MSMIVGILLRNADPEVIVTKDDKWYYWDGDFSKVEDGADIYCYDDEGNYDLTRSAENLMRWAKEYGNSLELNNWEHMPEYDGCNMDCFLNEITTTEVETVKFYPVFLQFKKGGEN